MSNKRLTVTVWADFVCPYCYLGKRRLEAALAEFEHRDQVDVAYKSFQLDPQAPVDGNPSSREMLAQKYGMTYEQVDATWQQLTAQARELGVEFHLADTIRTNTLAAHRLNHYAAEQHKQEAMTEALLKAHFVDGLHIGHDDTLVALATEAGLQADAVQGVLQSNTFADEVLADQAVARQIGVTGVPFFIVGETHIVRGAQPAAVLLRALQQAWATI